MENSSIKRSISLISIVILGSLLAFRIYFDRPREAMEYYGKELALQNAIAGSGYARFQERDFCSNYYAPCNFVVTKCRYNGFYSCEIWMQTPCSVACGYF
jgi:hypothetical protein